MKKSALLCAAFLHGLIVADSLHVQVKKITSDNLERERILFKQCLHSVYKDYSLEQLGLTDLSEHLRRTFDEEERRYHDTSFGRLFFHALYDNRVVGYLSFEVRDIDVSKKDQMVSAIENELLLKNVSEKEMKGVTLSNIVAELSNNHAVHIGQIALLPDFCTVDVVKDLVSTIFDSIVHVSCIHMKLPVQAVALREISKELGFVEQCKELSDSGHSFYAFLTMQCNKCGTCMCDLDYSDLDEEAEIVFEDLERVEFEMMEEE